nr:MAG TPA: BppU domain protein [Caudoviricetes sp.]
MAIVYSNVTVSLTKQTSVPIVEMVQGDTGRGLDVFVSDDIITDEVAYTDDSLTATLWASKPSGLMVSMDATSVSRFQNSNAYEIKFSDSKIFQQIIAEVGIVQCQINVLMSGEFVTSFPIKINVIENITESFELESKEEFRNAIELLAKQREYIRVLEDYVSQFQEQLKLTVNVRYGTSDPTVLSTDKQGDIYIKYKE